MTTSEGISTEYITGGRSKDLGNPYRPLTDEERTILQTGANNAYGKFVNYIVSQRDLNAEELRGRVGALIYDEILARELGLIDNNLNRDQAYVRLAELAGVKDGDFQIKKVKNTGGFWDSLLSSTLLSKFSTNKTSLPSFCYERAAVLVYSGNLSAICH